MPFNLEKLTENCDIAVIVSGIGSDFYIEPQKILDASIIKEIEAINDLMG